MNYFKVILITVFTFSLTSAFAQDAVTLEKRNELKINGFYMVIGAFEIDYEYIINEESSFGVAATYVFEDSEYSWGITPHYRLFFGKQAAQGFFVEGHGVLFGYDDYYSFFDGTDDSGIAGGVGIAVGAKFKTSRDVVAEIYGGLGRVFGDNNFFGAYPRAGISIGKRF